jgi:UrcA family protein
MNVRIGSRDYKALAIAFSALAIGSLTCHTSTASSNANTENVTVIVRYDDLNIHSATGRDALLRRVNRAVDHVCGVSKTSVRRWFRANDDCRRKSLESALLQLQLKMDGE